MNYSKEALEKIYSLRNNFIIIGLTGRTGSGCTELAKLFSVDKFHGLNAPNPHKGCDEIGNEDRKYKICHSFLKENWNSFTTIHFSDVILTFLINVDLSKLKEFISTTLAKDKESVKLNAISEELKKLRTDFIYLEENYEEFTQKNIITELNKDKDSNKITEFFTKAQAWYKGISFLRRKIKESYGADYYKLFQIFGDNIRASGDPIRPDINPKKLFSIPERVNIIIKVLRRYNKIYKKKDFFILDSIRNEMEAVFFRERFSAFYLLSVNSDNPIRHDRLIKLSGMNIDQINALDEKEYPATMIVNDNVKNKSDLEKQSDRLGEYFKFSSIDVQRCIEVADIHFVNNSNKEGLSTQIVKYLTLILRPGIIQPTSNERMMQIAYTAKFNSGCLSRQVGALICDNNHSVKTIGWNNAPCGQVSCALRSAQDLTDNDDKFAFSDYEKNNENFKNKLNEVYPNNLPGGLPKSYCFKHIKNKIDMDKNQVHTRSLHAEENAMLQLTKYGGMPLSGGYLFTTASPCELCSKKAYQLHIEKIVFIDPYPGIAVEHILSSGISKPKLELFLGVVGTAYFKLYEPFMSYKNELAIYNE